MSNLPIAMQSEGGQPPVLPEAMLAQYNDFALDMTQGFQGAYNRLKVGKMDFELVEGGVSRRVNNGDVVGVCLGMSGVDMCTWYEKTYEPTQEPEQPDLVWLWPDHNVFPAGLPEQYKQKRNRQGQERWDFRIARRSVWALLQPDPTTGQFLLNVDTPFIFDITSASLYGKSDVQQNWYKWAGLIQVCNRFSRPPSFICSPAMFLTRIRIDPTSTVSGVVMFEPLLSKSGALMYLDSQTFTQVVEVMQTQTVREMLQVREILQWPKNQSAVASMTVSQTATETVSTGAPAQPSPASVQPTAPTASAPQTSSPVQTPIGSPTPPAPPMQTATAVAQPTPTTENDAVAESRLAAAAAILNPGAAPASAQAEAAPAKPAASAPQQGADSPGMSNASVDALKMFDKML